MSRAKKNWDRLVKFDGNYGIDISKGIWPGSGLSQKGDVGPKGEPGNKGERGLQGEQGIKGKAGDEGPTGPQGEDGTSAYYVAVKGGFIGDEATWLDSLKGEQGEIGLTGEKGQFGDLTEDEKDRLKGDQGEQGQKGEPAGIFEFKGSQDSLASIEALPGPHTEGDVYKDDSTDDLYVWDGSQFVLLSEALDVVKGQKGEEGQAGLNGDKGEQGERGFRGQKGMAGLQGEAGDSAYDIAVKGGFKGTEEEWVDSLKGVDGLKGEDGAKGDQGDSAYDISQKGLDPIDVITEDEWLESLKGDKGENYDPLVLDDYYNKTQVDQLIDQLPDPDDAYDIHSMPDENIAEPGDTGDFLEEDPYHFLFNPGLVGVKSGAAIDNSPTAAPFVVRNVVLDNPTGLRDAQYAVLQEVIGLTGGGSTTSYIRTARPGSATFSPWSESTFDSSSYYNKSETDALLNAIAFTLDHDGAAITLTDKDNVKQTLQITGTNGIVVTSELSGINIDGAQLTPVPQFLGVLQDGQDPNILTPDATDGQYYVIGYTGVTVGTSPDGESCTPGDWVIYKTDSWLFLDISTDPGVVSVSVDSLGLLSIENSDPANPVVGLDPNVVVTPDELEEYVDKKDLSKVMTSIFVNDLADVEIEYTRVNFSGSTSRAVYALNAEAEMPDTAGQRGADIHTNTLYLNVSSTSGQGTTEFYNNINVNADPPQLIRVRGTGTGIGAGDERIGKCISKSSDGSVLTLQFETANVPLFSQGCPGEVTFDIVTEGLDHGAILTYDITGKLWKAGEAADYVKKEGDTMSGALVIDAPQPDTNSNSFRIHGRVDDGSGSLTDGILLKDYRRENSSTQADYVAYYGSTEPDEAIITKKFLTSGFLPLTGGQLKADGNTLTLSIVASDTLTDDGNVLVAKDKTGSNLLRLQNTGYMTLTGTFMTKRLDLSKGDTGEAGAWIAGTLGKGLWLNYGDEFRINTLAGDAKMYIFDDEIRLGGPNAANTPAMTVLEDSVRLHSALKTGFDAPAAGRLLQSAGGSAPPQWNTVKDILDAADLDYLKKPYTVYTGDLIGDLTPEAPDGNFHDGELYYSTLTEELFVYGNGNWWPTSVDWQADITLLRNDVDGKLNLTGGQVTGAVTTTTAITQPTQFATKQYVDDNSGAVEVLSGNKTNAQVGDMWFNKSANVMYVRVD